MQCWALVDVFHDLPRHRSEVDRSVIPKVHLSTLSKNGCNVPLLQSSGTSAAFHDLWQADWGVSAASNGVCTNSLLQAERRSSREGEGDREEGSLDNCPRPLRSSLTGKDQPYKALRPSTASLGLLLQQEMGDSLPAQLTLMGLNVTAEECCKAKAFIRCEGYGEHFGDHPHVLSLLAMFSDLALSL